MKGYERQANMDYCNYERGEDKGDTREKKEICEFDAVVITFDFLFPIKYNWKGE